MIVVRNKKTINVSIEYDGQVYVLQPNKSVTVLDFQKLLLPTNTVKIVRGVINIKDE